MAGKQTQLLRKDERDHNGSVCHAKYLRLGPEDKEPLLDVEQGDGWRQPELYSRAITLQVK